MVSAFTGRLAGSSLLKCEGVDVDVDGCLLSWAWKEFHIFPALSLRFISPIVTTRAASAFFRSRPASD